MQSILVTGTTFKVKHIQVMLGFCVFFCVLHIFTLQLLLFFLGLKIPTKSNAFDFVTILVIEAKIHSNYVSFSCFLFFSCFYTTIVFFLKPNSQPGPEPVRTPNLDVQVWVNTCSVTGL